MATYVLDFSEIDRTQVALVGGKAASLGELSRLEGVRVPPGFCLTTEAFRRVMATAPSIDERIGRLSELAPDEREAIGVLSAEIRAAIEAIAIPDDLAAAIGETLSRLGARTACAVRSSATAEDLPTASFAGLQDSWLGVEGRDAVVRHVGRCWASLYTDRAVTYRLRNGIDHRRVQMAVIVQQMVVPIAAGVLFTADPLTGNRRVASIEATPGLGEALVAGRVNPDVFRVRDGTVVERTLQQAQPTLTDELAVRLADIGWRIEAHFGRPQDIEWCLAGGDFAIVQSRPITTLFPIPAASDGENHVYVSVGHGQMMTDAMKPLGISMWQLTAAAPMLEAGARLFVDVTRGLASSATREGMLGVFGRGDPLIRDALETVLARDFIPLLPDDRPAAPQAPPAAAPPPIATDEAIVTDLIARWQESNTTAEREIATKSGAALIDFILGDVPDLKRMLFDARSYQAIMAGMDATWWLNAKLEEWLSEKNAADALAQSAPNNVTSEMGLALLDVADAIRPHPDVVSLLERADRDDFLDELPRVAGGREARDAIDGWLGRYGMRGPGEIDITRPRWRERPLMLVPVILANVRTFAPGEASRRFEQGKREALAKKQELLARLRALPDGAAKANEVERTIDRLRTFIGYREYPKYGMISRYFVYKRALMKEAARLVQAGVIREPEDIFFLRLEELRDVAQSGRVDERLLRDRREAFESVRALTPPRVLTSDGEMLSGAYRRGGVPDGALIGLPVSAGVVEGRARVVRNMADAKLEAGDILVTPFTDPSWTPLFVAAAGLVTEVGGLMTHGAVIAREYGLPAVVAVEQATRHIHDGQRIRVHGTEGYVELLD